MSAARYSCCLALLALTAWPNVYAGDDAASVQPDGGGATGQSIDCETLQQQLERTTRELVDLKIESDKIRQELRAWQRKASANNSPP